MSKTKSEGDDFASLFTAEEILCRTPIENRDDLVVEMIHRLAQTRGLKDSDCAVKAVLDRENTSGTILGKGIAVPHARLDSINEPLVAVATSAHGVKFAETGTSVQMVILILVPRDNPASYLRILSSLAVILKSDDAASKVSAFSDATEVHNFFKRGGIVLPDYVCAGDIMSPVKATLKDTNSIKDAIDFFVTHNNFEVPAVDKDGELVGIVSASALLKICVPDYMLWMEDLSPFMNFEPFVSLLKNEENTWLADVLSSNYACVEVDQPAIAVAEALARNDSGICYVVREKKLAGVITLPHFLNKIFRD